MLEPFFSGFYFLSVTFFKFSQVHILSEYFTLFAFTFFFHTGFLILSGQDGVIFDGGFGTSNSIGTAWHCSLFVSLWIVTLQK